MKPTTKIVNNEFYNKILAIIYRKSIENIPNECLRKTNDPTSDEYIHDDQINASKEVFIKYLENGTRHTNLVAQMQSGKTGCINALTNLIIYLKENPNLLKSSEKLKKILAIDTFFYITGMNSNGLKIQTIDRFNQIIRYAEEPIFYKDKKNIELKIYMIENYDRLIKHNITSKKTYESLNIKLKLSAEDKLFYLELFKNKKINELKKYSHDAITRIYNEWNKILAYENYLSLGINITYNKNTDLNKKIKIIDTENIDFKNTIIYLDESQYGTNENNVVTKILEACEIDLRNTFRLFNENSFIISVSATPFDELKANIPFEHINTNAKNMVYLPVGPNYIGLKKYKEAGCFRQYDPFDFEENESGDFPIIAKIKDAEDTRLNKNEFAYFVIRIPNNKEYVIENNIYIKENFKVILLTCDEKTIDYKDFIKNRDGIIESRIYGNNKQPVIFLIKGAFRAGMTIEEKYKDYCRLAYDLSKSLEPSLQGLPGRFSGYRSNLEAYKNTIIYTNLDYIDKYINWVDNDFASNTIPSVKLQKNQNEFRTESIGGFKIKLTNFELKLLKHLSSKKHKYEENPERNEHIRKILEKNGIVKTDNKIINYNLNTYNYVGTYLVNQNITYAPKSIINMSSTNSLSSFTPDENTKIGDVIINVNLIGNEFTVQRGRVLSNMSNTPKIAKRKQHFITDPNHVKYKGPKLL